MKTKTQQNTLRLHWSSRRCAFLVMGTHWFYNAVLLESSSRSSFVTRLSTKLERNIQIRASISTELRKMLARIWHYKNRGLQMTSASPDITAAHQLRTLGRTGHHKFDYFVAFKDKRRRPENNGHPFLHSFVNSMRGQSGDVQTLHARSSFAA